MGIFIGGTIHEVAHVVAAGNAINADASSNAIIVKMIRVMLLAPFLIILSIWLASTDKNTVKGERGKITIPWFAVMFIVMVGFNSFNFLPLEAIDVINGLDTFALTMAMSALGMGTSFEQV